MSLENEKTAKAIKIFIKSTEGIVDEESDPFHIIYRVYYKVTKLNYEFRALKQTSYNETIVVEANLKRSTINIPKKISHLDLRDKVPDEWIWKDALEQPKIHNTVIREIIQDGTDK